MKKIYKKPKNNNNWLQNHRNDFYVKKAKENNYRSRASYKLLEINKKFPLLKSSMKVLDVGSAPGGWCQVAIALKCKVWAVDILPMDPLPGVNFLQMDIGQNEGANFTAYYKLLLGSNKLNIILSDVACNTTGNVMVDHYRTTAINRVVVCCVPDLLVLGGHLIFKTFNGEETAELFREVKKLFRKAHCFKPDSSKSNSKEVYIIGENFIGNKTLDEKQVTMEIVKEIDIPQDEKDQEEQEEE